MRAATLLALMGVTRPIYHLIISNEAILIVLIIYILCYCLPHMYTVYYFTDPIKKLCLSVCLSME